jgi:hypothetical protein
MQFFAHSDHTLCLTNYRKNKLMLGAGVLLHGCQSAAVSRTTRSWLHRGVSTMSRVLHKVGILSATAHQHMPHCNHLLQCLICLVNIDLDDATWPAIIPFSASSTTVYPTMTSTKWSRQSAGGVTSSSALRIGFEHSLFKRRLTSNSTLSPALLDLSDFAHLLSQTSL